MHVHLCSFFLRHFLPSPSLHPHPHHLLPRCVCPCVRACVCCLFVSSGFPCSFVQETCAHRRLWRFHFTCVFVASLLVCLSCSVAVLGHIYATPIPLLTSLMRVCVRVCVSLLLFHCALPRPFSRIGRVDNDAAKDEGERMPSRGQKNPNAHEATRALPPSLPPH